MASITTSTIATRVEDVKLKPWNYEGYPGYAISGDFCIFHSIRQIILRILHFKQDQIKENEEALIHLDEGLRNGLDREGYANTLRYDPQEEREMILEYLDELRESLNKFTQYLVFFAELESWKSAGKRQTDNVEQWFANNPMAICEEEQEFILAGEDLSPFSRKKTKKSHHVESAITSYRTDPELDSFTNAVVIIIGLMLLIGPMWTLQFVTNGVKRLGIITGLTLLFTSIIAAATTAKPFEVLAATAAYSAVLMVFLQSSP